MKNYGITNYDELRNYGDSAFNWNYGNYGDSAFNCAAVEERVYRIKCTVTIMLTIMLVVALSAAKSPGTFAE
jgi:hypothetical protein